MLNVLFCFVGCYPLFWCVKGAKGRQENGNAQQQTSNEAREGNHNHPPPHHQQHPPQKAKKIRASTKKINPPTEKKI
jgi:hypothetical protein